MAMTPNTTPAAMAPTPVAGGATPAAIPTTVSMDLPPSIQQLIQAPTPGVNQSAVGTIPTGVQGGNPQYPVLDFRMQPSTFEQGGMVPPNAGMQGMAPQQAGLQPQQPQGGMPNPQMADMQVNDMLSKNPEVVARIRAAIEAGIQSGEISQQEIQMATQLAQVAMQNPAMYPQLRQFAIDRGLAGPNDLPMEYDQGLVIALVTAAKAMAADVQIESTGQQMPAQQMPMQQPPMQEMEFGGMVNGPSHDNGGVRVKMKNGGEIEVEGGEYVIPRDIVAKKGTEFFDKLIGKDGKTDVA